MFLSLFIVVVYGLTYNAYGWTRCVAIRRTTTYFNLAHQTTSSSRRSRRSRSKSRLFEIQNDAEIDAEDELDRMLYRGPLSDFEVMEQGFTVQESGLVLTLGPSKAARGRGLFLAVSNPGDVILLEKGTVLCGYSRGLLQPVASGDKSVGFTFKDLQASVLFNKRILPLGDAIKEISSMNSNINIAHCVYAHIVHKDEISGDSIQPDGSTAARTFIPDATQIDEVDVKNIGMFANDLAYNPLIKTEEEYLEKSKEKNILSLLWRLELSEGQLRPTWPVVVLKQDSYFSNTDPMEIGIEYSWRYWLASNQFS